MTTQSAARASLATTTTTTTTPSQRHALLFLSEGSAKRTAQRLIKAGILASFKLVLIRQGCDQGWGILAQPTKACLYGAGWLSDVKEG